MEQQSKGSSSLKELHQLSREKKIPMDFHLEKESGPPHAKLFTMKLRFGDKEYFSTDRSIKSAQRSVAQLALDDRKDEKTSINDQNDDQQEKTQIQSATVVLNTWAAKHHIPTRYVLIHHEYLPIQPNSLWPRQMFHYRLFIGEDFRFDGRGPSHGKARFDCAVRAVNFLRENHKSIFIIPPSDPEIPVKSSVSEMYERAQKLGLTVRVTYPSPFTVQYEVGEKYSTIGNGTTKQIAKQIGAEKMLELLPIPETKIKKKRTMKEKKFVEQRGSFDYHLSDDTDFITRLKLIARAKNVQIEFNEVKKTNEKNLFYFEVLFGNEESAEGSGRSKSIARQTAAENLLKKLNPNSSPSTPTKSLLKQNENIQKEKKHVHFLLDEKEKTIKERLKSSAERFNVQLEYEDQLIKTNQYQSTLSLKIDDRLLAQFRSSSSSIEEAQENVSIIAWKNLQQFFDGTVQLTSSDK